MLDMDGVLNSGKGWKRDEPEDWRYFTPECVEMFRGLMALLPEVKIVISSSWRYELPVEGFQKLFKELGINADVIGQTPIGKGDVLRGDEIQSWLDANSGVTDFVILDDDADMGKLADHLVQTNFENGLTDCEVEDIIRRLS